MQTKFADVLESVENLPAEEKEMLVDIVRNRMVEERRVQLRAEIDSSRHEYESGEGKTVTADEVMDEVLS